MKGSIWNWLLVTLSLIALGWYLVATEGWQNIKLVCASLDYRWIAIAMASSIAYWMLDAYITLIILRRFSLTIPYAACLRSTLVGLMFGFITPLQSGNIVAQSVVLSSRGIASGDAVSVLLVKNIAMVAASVLLMSTAYLSGSQTMLSSTPVLRGAVFTGILLNLLFIGAMVASGLAERTVTRIACAGITFLAAIKLVKHPDAQKERWTAQIHRMQMNFSTLGSHSGALMLATAVSLLAMLSTFQVTYFIHHAFPLPPVSYIEAVSGQIFSMTIQSITPLPGGVGAAEGGFHTILEPIFTKEYINYGLLLWRLFTLYVPIAVGMIALALGKPRNRQATA